MLNTLATIISISDDDMTWIVIILMLVGLIMMCSGMMGITKAKREAEERSRQTPPSPPPTPVKQDIPTWKRIEMEATQSTAPAAHKCIFCGADMAENQIFCGTCGRRKD